MQMSCKAILEQYSKHPYPGIPLIATPRAQDFSTLNYSGLCSRAGISSYKSPRILVAGAGTFEPVAVAKANPGASILAVDLSANSLRRARIRGLIARTWFQMKVGDLHDDLKASLGEFDLVICTGVLHHSPNPELMLSRLAALTKPGGLLRLMIYPWFSREPLRQLERRFKDAGLSAETPNLMRRCREIVEGLPPGHPDRDTFARTHDARNLSGLIDAYFHAHVEELPLSRLEKMSVALGLKLRCTLQDQEVAPTWDAISALDSARGFSVNPVLLLQRT